MCAAEESGEKCKIEFHAQNERDKGNNILDAVKGRKYYVSTMEFARPLFDRATVNWAGDSMRGPRNALRVYNEHDTHPEEVIYNWRLSHATHSTRFKWLYVVGHLRLTVGQLWLNGASADPL